MFHLTVGYIAGIIAALIFFARLWGPSAATFMLSGLLPDSNSAATLTIAGRAFQRSYWPLILRGDSGYNHGAPKRIIFLSRSISLLSILIAIAAVITPLGLYETLMPAKNVQPSFQYLKDSSSFGSGTPPRSNYSFNRLCFDLNGLGGPVPCPFSDTVADITYYANGTIDYHYPYGYELDVPNVILDTYSSGTENNTTVSNFFDIQWRQYLTTTNPQFNNGTRYLIGSFRSMESIVMNNAYQTVEGLVADTINGGIGFRNHTAPPGFQYGAQWVEDLLFVEPETVCVDTNLTLDFTIGSSFNSSFASLITDLVLTDRGGFSSLNHTYPEPNLTNPQQNADLYGRAYKAAWLNNAYTALYYNVTDTNNNITGAHAWSYINSFVGKTFSLPAPTGSYQTSNFDSLFITTTFGDYLQLDNSLGEDEPAVSDSGVPTNPFNVSAASFDPITTLCSGAGGEDYANITGIYVVCGLIHGVPQRQDDGSRLIFDGGSRWSQPLYTCASTVKATVKTVSFNYNGTRGSLQDLAVIDIQEKSYADTSDMPLWGVEKTGTEFDIGVINLVWGIVSSEYENSPNVSTVRQESLYLPGFTEGTLLAPIETDNLPGGEFYSAVLNIAYNVEDSATRIYPQVDYTGDISMGMWTRWQNLSRSAQTASLIPNLIWTDNAASAVVGTKGVLGPMNSGHNVVPLQVTPTIQKVKYHYPFAIPAFLAAICLIIFTIGAFGTVLFGHGGLASLRSHLHQVSPGRIYTAFLYPESGAMTMKSKDWNKQMGTRMVDLSGDFPMAGDVALGENGTLALHEKGGSEDRPTENDGFLGHASERSEEDIDGSELAQPHQYTAPQKLVPPTTEFREY